MLHGSGCLEIIHIVKIDGFMCHRTIFYWLNACIPFPKVKNGNVVEITECFFSVEVEKIIFYHSPSGTVTGDSAVEIKFSIDIMFGCLPAWKCMKVGFALMTLIKDKVHACSVVTLMAAMRWFTAGGCDPHWYVRQ